MRVILFFIFLIGAFSLSSQERDDKNFKLSKNLKIYHSVLRELNLLYVDEIEAEKLIQTSIDEMLSSLDPYTAYIPEEDMADFKTMTTGEYGGIGSTIRKHGDYVVIAEPYKDFPADKSGLKAGDKILELDGKDAKGMSTLEVTDIMKGEVNTSFDIKIERAGSGEIKEMTIVREKIKLDCVPYYGMVTENLGYIMFTNFTTKAETQVKEAVEELKKEGAKGLIIDVRGNAGGLLDQAVKIVNLFIGKDELVVETKGKIMQWNQQYKTEKLPLDTEIPLVVLTSRNSASAAEILAGTMQDLDRGIIVGTRTFGKGLVQATRPLNYNSSLKLTTSKYYIPSGRCIQALDYTHKNEDGSVGHIPDSLISAYKTRNQRTVYDGAGIMPDVKVEQEMYSKLTAQLIIDSKIFDYANEYANKRTSIDASAKEFALTDEEYADFKEYVKSHEFTYKSNTNEEFKEFLEAAKGEKYDLVAMEEIKALEEKIKPNLDKDLEVFEDEIRDLLNYEIVNRFYYKKGAIAYSLKDDLGVKKAIEILEDKETYKGMLDGSIPVASSEKEIGKKEK